MARPGRIWLGLVLLIAAATLGRWWSAAHLYDRSFRTAGRLSGDEVIYLVLGDRLMQGKTYSTRELAPTLRGSTEEHGYLYDQLFKHPPLFPASVGAARAMFPGARVAAFIPSLLMGALSRRHAPRVHPPAMAAGIRAMRQPGFAALAGLFWGCALLTKYTAIIAWVGALGATVVAAPSIRRDRRFWLGHSIGLLLFLPWIGWAGPGGRPRRACVLAGRIRRVVDSHRPSSEVGHPPRRRGRGILVVAEDCAQDALARIRHEIADHRLGHGRLRADGDRNAPDVRVPRRTMGRVRPEHLRRWTRSFYFTRQILFEPICWWGFLGVVLVARRGAWDVVRWTWVGLFVFLTLWRHFESRYGLLLVPFEHALAIALLFPGASAAGVRRQPRETLVAAIVAGWLIFSIARSLFIVKELGIENQFFYF